MEYYIKFKDELLEILAKYSNIRELAATPINAIMLCLICSDPEIRETIKEGFNINSQYDGIITWLGKRYESKITSNQKKLIKDIKLEAEELKVLKSISNDGFITNKWVKEGVLINQTASKIGKLNSVTQYNNNIKEQYKRQVAA